MAHRQTHRRSRRTLAVGDLHHVYYYGTGYRCAYRTRLYTAAAVRPCPVCGRPWPELPRQVSGPVPVGARVVPANVMRRILATTQATTTQATTASADGTTTPTRASAATAPTAASQSPAVRIPHLGDPVRGQEVPSMLDVLRRGMAPGARPRPSPTQQATQATERDDEGAE